MALLSPGIQLFESSVTPAAPVAAAENGVASLGYSTKGPTNKLTKISSVSEFAEIFGDPIAEYPYAHIMGQAVLANNTDFYFMRLADSSAKTAKCPVVDFAIKGAREAIKDMISATQKNAGYFMAGVARVDQQPITNLDAKPIFRVYIDGTNPANAIDTEMSYAADFGPAGNIKPVVYVSIVDVISNLQKSTYGSRFTFKQVGDELNGEIGIVAIAKNDTEYTSSALVLEAHIGEVAGTVFSSWDGSGTASSQDYVVSNYPTVLKTGTFGGEELREHSTLYSDPPVNILANNNHFELSAKYPGSAMNGVRVTKTTTTSSTDPTKQTWTVTVYDGEGILESRTGITPDNFLEEMTKFEYIEIEDEVRVASKWSWHDGSWDLGEGEVLSNGDHWTQTWTGYPIEKGSDGFPTVEIDSVKQYSESQSVNLYLRGLGSDEFLNTDEFSFSILATPGIQNTMVQNAAINVCATRGDAIYLADVPEQLCKAKQSIEDVASWANGNSGFQSSYCAIYYGWFAQTNPYDTDNSIFCPASCFIAPKMVALDQSMGEFYAPAGIARGGIICSDYLYSPDQKDRDVLVGNDNVVNPISYSNTRGVTIMAQKTTDRTTSPLNRVGIRRMTNAIKRNLRSRLVALLFEPNNEVARSRARTIVDNVMAALRSNDCIETYDINVVSGTGANRNDLNVYLSYAPYGLIEKIYVYLSITDAGVETTETVA